MPCWSPLHVVLQDERTKAQAEEAEARAEQAAAALLAEEEADRAKAQAVQAKKDKKKQKKAAAKAQKSATQADTAGQEDTTGAVEAEEGEVAAATSLSAAGPSAGSGSGGSGANVNGGGDCSKGGGSDDVGSRRSVSSSKGGNASVGVETVRGPDTCALPASPGVQPSSSCEDDRWCVVCLERRSCQALVPCGHIVMCGPCCEAVQAAKNEVRGQVQGWSDGREKLKAAAEGRTARTAAHWGYDWGDMSNDVFLSLREDLYIAIS